MKIVAILPIYMYVYTIRWNLFLYKSRSDDNFPWVKLSLRIFGAKEKLGIYAYIEQVIILQLKLISFYDNIESSFKNLFIMIMKIGKYSKIAYA